MTGEAAAICEAAAQGEFTAAYRLWEDYIGRLRSAVVERTASAGMIAEASEVLDACRLAARVHRERAADGLRSCQVARSYGQTAERGPGLLRKAG